MIKLANGLPLPKAGPFAEAEGYVVAAQIAARRNGGAPDARFTGDGVRLRASDCRHTPTEARPASRTGVATLVQRQNERVIAPFPSATAAG